MSALTPSIRWATRSPRALEVHNRDIGKRAARTRAVELLELVGIAQPERRASAFRTNSGGSVNEW
jgi:peptide/nickel transport system ATP-binding protein